jgi:hypothetical protein
MNSTAVPRRKSGLAREINAVITIMAREITLTIKAPAMIILSLVIPIKIRVCAPRKKCVIFNPTLLIDYRKNKGMGKDTKLCRHEVLAYFLSISMRGAPLWRISRTVME